MKKLLAILLLFCFKAHATHFTFGTPGSSASLTSMSGHSMGDTGYIAAGNYTVLVIQNLDSIHILALDQNNPPVFSQSSTVSKNRWCEIAYLKFIWGSGAGSGWQMNGGRDYHNVYHDLYFYGWNSTAFSKHNGFSYTYGDHTTSVSDNDTWHDIIVDSCAGILMGSFSGAKNAVDVFTNATFYNIQDVATSLCCGNGQGTGIRGVFFHLTVHDCFITDRSGRGADGDVGWLYITGGSVHAWNIVKWGGPGSLIRDNDPMMESGDTWDNQVSNCGKFQGTQYGGLTFNAILADTVTGKTIGTDDYMWNFTLGNQINDTNNYESPAILCGQSAAGKTHHAWNVFGFNIGNNNQRAGAGGHPNNNKPQIYDNLGGWSPMDTSHGQYYHDATLAKLDSTSITYTNRIGSWVAYTLTGASPNTLIGAGTTTPILTSTPDIKGSLPHSPPDLGYLQLLPSAQTPMNFTRLAGDFSAPGKGAQNWGLHTWNDITQPTIPAGNTVAKNYYTRFNLLDIVSNTGVYSWTAFDNYVNQCIDAGAMFSFGLMPLCDGCGSGGLIPTYIQTAMTSEGKPGPNIGGVIYPNYQSTSWKNDYCAIMRTVANHIATTSRSGHLYSTAFLAYDLRHAGNFGEFADLYNNAQYGASAQVTDTYLNAMVDSAIAIYPNVQLTIPMGYFTQNGSLYGNSSGAPGQASAYKVLTATNNYGRIGWRRDNIGDDGYNVYFTGNTGSYNPGSGVVQFQPIIMGMWKFAPIGGEPSSNQGGVSRCGTIYCDMTNEQNLFHMTYFGNGNGPGGISNASGQTWTDLQAMWRNTSAAMGYKLTLDSGNVTANPSTGGTWNIQLYWKNIGIAPVYDPRWKIIFELRKTSDQSVQWRDTSKFSMRYFLPQATDSIYTDNYLLTGVPASTYDLHLWIKDSVGYMSPFPLAITGRQADGSYIIKSGLVISSSATPTANAGLDQAITLPVNSVTLSGSLSSGSISSYLWTKISGPGTPTIVTPTTVSTNITGMVQGTYIFQLSLNSGASVDSVTVTVNPALPPIANAGSDQSITLPVSSVTLDASASTGNISTYLWTQISGPNTASITFPTISSTSVTSLIVGTYVFQLQVSGPTGSTTDQINVVVNAVPPTTYNIFGNLVPAGPAGADAPVELGLKFKSSVAGYVTGVRFYKFSNMTGTHKGELYDTAGNRLAQVTFTGETASGWQQMSFSTPVFIPANTVYIISYYNAAGIYYADNSGLFNPFTNFSLTAIANGDLGGNGVYNYGGAPVFPTLTFQQSNYFVDVVFAPIQNFQLLLHRKSTITIWK